MSVLGSRADASRLAISVSQSRQGLLDLVGPIQRASHRWVKFISIDAMQSQHFACMAIWNVAFHSTRSPSSQRLESEHAGESPSLAIRMALNAIYSQDQHATRASDPERYSSHPGRPSS